MSDASGIEHQVRRERTHMGNFEASFEHRLDFGSLFVTARDL